MAKIEPLSDVGSLANTTSARAVINANAQRIEEAFDNTLSRDGSGPNEMHADIDLNGHHLLNIADPVADTDAVNLRSVRPLVERFGQQIVQNAVMGAPVTLTAVATAGQTDFTLPSSAGFVSNVEVFVDGLALRAGLDFVLSGALANKVILTTPLSGGEEVFIRYAQAMFVGIPDDPQLRADLLDPVLGTTLVSYKGRSLTARLDETLSVKDFGAKGDGVTDDTATIKAAIAAAAGKARLHFPAGVYLVSESLQVPSYSHLFGDGMDKSIIRMAASVGRGTPLIYTGRSGAHVTQVVIEDMQADFNAARHAVSGGTWIDPAHLGSTISIVNSSYVTLRRVKAIDAYKHCFDVTAPTYGTNLNNATTYDPEPSHFVWIEGCYASGAGDDNFTTHQSSYIWISNCVSEDSGGHYTTNSNAYEIDDGSRNVFLSDNIARRCVNGIQIKGHFDSPAPYNVTVDGLQVFNCIFGITCHHGGWYGTPIGNLLLDRWSALETTSTPPLAYTSTNSISTEVVENAAAFFGHEFKFSVNDSPGGDGPENNRVFFAADELDWNMPLSAGTYIISYYARATTGGQEVRPFLRVPSGSWGTGLVYGDTATLTTSRTRYYTTVTVPDFATAGLAGLLGFQPNRNASAGNDVFVDGLMVERAALGQTTPSDFVLGPDEFLTDDPAVALGVSPTARNLNLSNITIVAPREKVSGGVLYPAYYQVRLRSYENVQISNLIISDGTQDLGKGYDGYEPATTIGNPSLVRVYAGARNVTLNGLSIYGFKDLVGIGVQVSSSVGRGVSFDGVKIIDGPRVGVYYPSGTMPISLDNYAIHGDHLADAGSVGIRMASVAGSKLGGGTMSGYTLPVRFGGVSFPSNIEGTRKLSYFRDGISVYSGTNVARINSDASNPLFLFDRSNVNYGAMAHSPSAAWWLINASNASNLNLGSYPDEANNGTRTAFLSVRSDALSPVTNNVRSLGLSTARWTEVFATTGAINTSDAREKTPVVLLTEQELAAAEALAEEIGTFQWLESVDRKGQDARLHVGMTVQRAIEIMEDHGLDPMRYGLICYDEWDAQDEVWDEWDDEYEDGVLVREAGRVLEQPAREAGSLYSFRPDQLALFLVAGERTARKKLEARIAALENA